MNVIIRTLTGRGPIERSREVAAKMQAGDTDWTYEVVDCSNGLGRIDVYDEENELVIEGFLA